MVMSQAAIDALMARNAAKESGNDAEDDDLTGDVMDTAVADESAASVAEAEQPAAEPIAGDSGEEEIDPLAGTLSAQELARVQQLASGPPPPPTALAQKVETDPGAAEATGVKARKWSASSTADSELKGRIQEIEAKLTQMEAQRLASGGTVSDQQLNEMRSALAEISETVQGMMAALRQLTEQSKGSLGFAAKQTFDCPECHSHGTISVPISCTACGFESEWGFYPESK